MLTRTSVHTRKLMSYIILISGILTGNAAFSDPQSNANTGTNATPVQPTEPGTEINSGNTSLPEETSPSPDASPEITRSQFTTAITNREPTDNVVMLTNNSEQIYFFSELANLKGREVTHRWEFQGKVMAEVKFEVKSNRWRVFSSKNIKPDWIGEWSVALVDENGSPLDVSKLNIVEASPN